MSKEQVNFTEHNYDPLNSAIEESIRAQRAKSSWMFAKVFALVLVSIGILALLLAWAYNIYKRPNPEIVRKINEVDRKFEQSKNIDKQQEKIVDGEIIKYNSETYRFLEARTVKFNVTTRLTYKTTKDLLEGNSPEKIECYISDGITKFEFDDPDRDQKEAIKNLNTTLNELKTYKKYCKYNVR